MDRLFMLGPINMSHDNYDNYSFCTKNFRKRQVILNTLYIYGFTVMMQFLYIILVCIKKLLYKNCLYSIFNFSESVSQHTLFHTLSLYSKVKLIC